MENSFSDRIRKLRQDMDITQSELANKLGITTTALSFFESGSRIPNIEVLKNMAVIFGVSSDYLLGLETSNKDLKTYADVLAALVPILELENIWNMSIDKATFEEYLDCISDPEEREMIYTMANSAGTPYNKNDTYSIGSLKTVNHILIGFFEDFQKVYLLYVNGSMPESLYKLWIDDRISKLKNIPLPGTDPDEQ